LDGEVEYDDLMLRAYGSIPAQSTRSVIESNWKTWWKVIIQHLGIHYILPGGLIGRRYVETLAEEINHLSCGKLAL